MIYIDFYGMIILLFIFLFQIACGFAYSAAVDVTGKVYTWGAGENGRLGLGDTADRFSPVLVTALQHIIIDFVAAGSVHTCMKSQRGDIYSCGKFEYTGHGSNVDILIPTLLNYFDHIPIKQLSGTVTVIIIIFILIFLLSYLLLY